jgi:hypothetical protein
VFSGGTAVRIDTPTARKATLLFFAFAIPALAGSNGSSPPAVCSIAVFPPSVEIWVATNPVLGPEKIDPGAYQSTVVSVLEAELDRQGFDVKRNAFPESLREQAGDRVRKAWAELSEAPAILTIVLGEEGSESAAILADTVGVDALVLVRGSGFRREKEAKKMFTKEKTKHTLKALASFGYLEEPGWGSRYSKPGFDLRFSVFSARENKWLQNKKTGTYIEEVVFGPDYFVDPSQNGKIRRALKRWGRPAETCEPVRQQDGQRGDNKKYSRDD